MGHVSEYTRKRREERAARVAAVRALGIKPGDWIVSHERKNRAFRATPSHLDARHYGYQWLRRATKKEIEVREAEEAERKRKQTEQDLFYARADVRAASRILSSDVHQLLKLGPEFLAEIVSRLDVD